MFLTDENIPPKVVEFLRSKGYKVKDVREDCLQGISDDNRTLLIKTIIL